ncbi:uncharacterized protein DFL_001432 [Arthrobotrys flagrans]|uniref:Major facilitator superfamily (MFS) profile domain-containing protein n=1 Tax=Arthrobotrys flagrans TaxID=97331 RepID=A0A437A7M6_ARTFL|nr:hypothetical protein DFL_001432 [Arthrobotrys flagrans]
MWSVVQYRSLGKVVKQEVHDHEKRQEDNGHHSNPLPEAQPTDDRPERTNGEDRNDLGAYESEEKLKIEVEGHDDPINPKNWSLLSRSKNIAILALLIAVQAWAGAAESIANTSASQEFGVSKEAETLSAAMYLFGLGSGCLFVGPLSETVGRNPVYLISTFCYLFFVLGTALAKSFGGQIVCRYFVGLFSSGTLGINGASVRDQFRPVKRAFVFPVIAWANVVPPTLAPIVGGWILESPSLTWRWTDWITLIISGFAFLAAFAFLPETYLPMLLGWKAKKLRKVTGRQYFSEHAKKASFWERLKHTLPMSLSFFLKEPVVTVLGSYLVLLYVLLFTFLSGFEYIFKKTYNLSDGMTGSCFGAIAAGATAFTLCAPGFYSWARHHTEYVSGAHIKPEFRLWPAIFAAPLLPISLFWLGFTTIPTISIWSGLAACFCFGIVLIAMYVASYEYIIDSYGDHAAIALASVTMVRYLIAGGMALAARPMYEGIGVRGTMGVLGGLAVVLMPGPGLLYVYGHKMRKKSRYAKSEVGDTHD